MQECFIPDLRITAGTETGVRATIVSITWRGMRCFVEAEAAGTGIVADLRLGQPGGASVAASAKALDIDGTVSLVLADDQYENAELIVVLLGPDGTVLGQRKTRVGATT